MTQLTDDRQDRPEPTPPGADPNDAGTPSVARLDDEATAAEAAEEDRDHALTDAEAALDAVTLPPLPIVGRDG